jgi:penicillin amidase
MLLGSCDLARALSFSFRTSDCIRTVCATRPSDHTIKLRMSLSPTISAPSSRRTSIVLRMAGWLLLLVIAPAATTITYFYFVVRSALPQLDGSLRVEGLTARVTVRRDAHGVPAIEAQTLEDLFFAQGYVTAQDRLWQMDAMRRFAGGELSQVLGEGLLEHDREQRILGLRAMAKQAVERLPARDRSYFEAYAGGVNAYIRE